MVLVNRINIVAEKRGGMSQSSSLIIDGKLGRLLQPVGSSSVPYLHVPRQHCLMVLEKRE